MTSEESRLERIREFQIRLEESFRRYSVNEKESVYLMPSYFFWKEVGRAATNVRAHPVFVDLDTEVLKLAHDEFPNSKCILRDVTYPLDPLPEGKIHWVLYRLPIYVFHQATEASIPVPGISLALKSHRDYVSKLYIYDTMTQKATDDWRKYMDQDFLRLFPTDFEETVKLLDVCGYRAIDTSSLGNTEARFIVAEPAK